MNYIIPEKKKIEHLQLNHFLFYSGGWANSFAENNRNAEALATPCSNAWQATHHWNCRVRLAQALKLKLRRRLSNCASAERYFYGWVDHWEKLIERYWAEAVSWFMVIVLLQKGRLTPVPTWTFKHSRDSDLMMVQAPGWFNPHLVQDARESSELLWSFKVGQDEYLGHHEPRSRFSAVLASEKKLSRFETIWICVSTLRPAKWRSGSVRGS